MLYARVKYEGLLRSPEYCACTRAMLSIMCARSPEAMDNSDLWALRWAKANVMGQLIITLGADLYL